MGNVSIKPKGIANKAVPSCASLKCSFCCKVGIRLAHVENPNPDTKKNTATAIRICFGDDVVLIEVIIKVAKIQFQ